MLEYVVFIKNLIEEDMLMMVVVGGLMKRGFLGMMNF